MEVFQKLLVKSLRRNEGGQAGLRSAVNPCQVLKSTLKHPMIFRALMYHRFPVAAVWRGNTLTGVVG